MAEIVQLQAAQQCGGTIGPSVDDWQLQQTVHAETLLDFGIDLIVGAGMVADVGRRVCQGVRLENLAEPGDVVGFSQLFIT